MSRPAASCALMTAATASRYCSRNNESPSADLNDRPSRLRSNHKGRGYDPVIAVGNIMSRVVFSIVAFPPSIFRTVSDEANPHEERRAKLTFGGIGFS